MVDLALDVAPSEQRNVDAADEALAFFSAHEEALKIAGAEQDAVEERDRIVAELDESAATELDESAESQLVLQRRSWAGIWHLADHLELEAVAIEIASGEQEQHDEVGPAGEQAAAWAERERSAELSDILAQSDKFDADAEAREFLALEVCAFFDAHAEGLRVVNAEHSDENDDILAGLDAQAARSFPAPGDVSRGQRRHVGC